MQRGVGESSAQWRLVVCFFCAWCLSLGAGFGVASARTWRVPTDLPTIRAAIDAAVPQDTVRVEHGLYFEHGLEMKAGVHLLGDELMPERVVVDAENRGRILECDSLTETTVIAGMKFVRGLVEAGWIEALGGGIRCLESKVVIRNCIFSGNRGRIGGGVGARSGELTLITCRFERNLARDPEWAGGGAVWCHGTTGEIQNCTFERNSARSEAQPGDGGGVFCNGGWLVLNACSFRDNGAGAGAGAFYSVSGDSAQVFGCWFENNTATWGGAAYVEAAFTHFEGCVFVGNAAQSGGAMLIGRDAAPRLDNCRFEGNRATTGTGGAIDCWQSTPVLSRAQFRDNVGTTGGGGLNIGGSNARLEGCVFFANRVDGQGGAVRAYYSDVELSGCSLVGNAAGAGGGLHCGAASTAVIERTIIAFSPAGAGIDSGGAYRVELSCSNLFGNSGGDWIGPFADQLGTAGNLAIDPVFCNLAAGNLALDNASPCAPLQSNGCGLIGALGAVCRTPTEVGSVPTDFAVAPSFPNPFNPRTSIRFSLPEPAQVRVAIHDLAGRCVRVLVDRTLAAGAHAVTWDGRDAAGRSVAAGSYLVVVQAGDRRAVDRVTLVR
jgi:hypothetical protein